MADISNEMRAFLVPMKARQFDLLKLFLSVKLNRVDNTMAAYEFASIFDDVKNGCLTNGR